MNQPRTRGVFATDRDLVVRAWDDWMASATGISHGAAAGRPLLELFPEIAERGFDRRLRQVIDGGAVEVLAPSFHRYLIPCDPAEPSPYFERMQQYVTLSPLRVGEEVTGVVVEIQDVTARRSEERRLAEQLRGGNEQERVRAAEVLSSTDGSADVLLPSFGDSSWRVRQLAVEGVARDPRDEVVAALVESLRDQHRDLAVLNSTLSTLARSGADVLPHLQRLLEEDDADLRTYVALGLGQLGDPRAVPALIGVLGDEDPNVRFHAIEALARLRARPAAPALAAIVATRDFFLAFSALEALAAIAEPSVGALLLPLLDDELLGPAAIDALETMGDEEVVLPMVRRLDTAGAPLGKLARALASIHARLDAQSDAGELVSEVTRREMSAAGEVALLQALPLAEGEEKEGIVRVLGWLDAAGSETALLDALSDPFTRLAAVDGLVRRGAPAVPVLVDRLPTLDGEARKAAVVALGRLGSPDAVPSLIQILDAESSGITAAAGALGAIGDPRAGPRLLELLDHPEAAARQAAVGALNSIGDPEMEERIGALLDQPSARVRESAAKIAGYFGYPSAIAGLVRLCGDPAPEVRSAAVEAIVYASEAEAPAAVAAALRDPVPVVRAAAARAAAQLPEGAGWPLLREALRDSDLWVRYYAVRAAGTLRSPAAAAELAPLAIADAAIPVRIAATQALGTLDAEADALLTLADDPIPEVAWAALEAIGGAEHPRAVTALQRALLSADQEHAGAALAGLRGAAAVALWDDAERVARGVAEHGLRDAAVRVLVVGGPARAVGVLCDVASADPSYREPCVRTLVSIAPAQLPALEEVVSGGIEDPSLVVVEVLARRRVAGAASLLARMVDGPSPAVRDAAAHALRRLDLRAMAGVDEDRASGVRWDNR